MQTVNDKNAKGAGSEMKGEPGTLDELKALLAKFDTVMLSTMTPEGTIRSRPMATQDPAKVAGCDFWFVTSAGSPKADEIARTHEVCVSAYASGKYLSISGRARIVQDRELIQRLWQDDWKSWFPEGRDDPRIAIVTMEVTRADWFDPAGGLARVLFDRLAAALQGVPTQEKLPPTKHLS